MKPKNTIKAQVVKFNTPDANGDVVLPTSIDASKYEEMKLGGYILDYEIDRDGVRVIKEMKTTNVSL